MLLDGRSTSPEIAKQLGLTKEVVQKNYAEMERKGVINGATIHINYRGFGYKAVAHILIRVDPAQEVRLVVYFKKMPEVYSFYKSGPRGNMDAILILKTLQQLGILKDAIKSEFSVLEMKTGIWTDVKEMHGNLAIVPDESANNQNLEYQIKAKRANDYPRKNAVDQIDQKIADILSEDGRASIETIAKRTGIAKNIVNRRYRKLKKNGLLKVTIQIDPVKIGYRALGIFFAVVSHEDSSAIIDKISAIPDVISIMKISGDYDLQIYAMIKNIDHLLSIQEKLEKIPGMSKMDMELYGMLRKWPTPRQYISTF